MDANRYHWRVVYNDGTELKQVENPLTDDQRSQLEGQGAEIPEEVKNSYHDIDRTKPFTFELWDWKLGERALSVDVHPGQSLIWRRRTVLKGGIAEVIHLVGKKEKVNNKTHQGVLALFESNGHIEVLDNFKEDHPWFAKPQLHPEEDF